MSAHSPRHPDRDDDHHNRKVRRYTVLGLWLAAASLVVAAIPVTMTLMRDTPGAGANSPTPTPPSPQAPDPAPAASWVQEQSQSGVIMLTTPDCPTLWLDFDKVYQAEYDSGVATDPSTVPATADYVVTGCPNDVRAYPAEGVQAGEAGEKNAESGEACAAVAARDARPEWRFAEWPHPRSVHCLLTAGGDRLARVLFVGLDGDRPEFEFTTWVRE